MALIAALSAASLFAVIYLTRRTHRFSFLLKLSQQHRVLSWVLSLVPVAICLCFLRKNLFTMFVVTVHLLVFWLVCDLVGRIVRKIRKKPWTRNWSGAAAIVITVVYLGIGLFFGYHVFEKDYSFTTAKDLGESLRIVEIADSHLGATLNGERFAAAMDKLQKTEPDAVVVVGDFVDDDSSREDMLAACRALGQLKTTYGVYFVYGNHDKGYFNYRNFSVAELLAALEENHVTVMEDEAILVDGRFYLIGRQDRSAWGRADMQTLTAGLDASKYMILLDHQPNDYDSEQQAGVDLVLSGHTHGGHIWPVGQLATMGGLNDQLYGTERRGETDFVVTSGISAWAIPFKTGCISEFVVIDILPE